MTIIAHVTTVHPLSDPRILRKECRALVAAGHDVYLVGPGRTENELLPHEDGVRIVKTAFARGRLARALKGSVRVWAELRRIRPEVVHGHDPELLPLLAVWRVVNQHGAAIYDAHESLLGQIDGKTHIPPVARPLVKLTAVVLTRIVARSLDGVVAATRYIEQETPARRSCTVQNFPWSSSYPNYEDVQKSQNFCYVGGISRLRGIDEMIRGLKDAGGGSRLELAGSADEYSETILDLHRDVLNYRGVVDSGEIPEILRSSVAGFVLLQPLENYLQSQPTKLFEYMAAGIPFIASSFPYWKDMVGEFDAGYFVDPSDADQVASAIRHVLNNRNEASLKGMRGRLAFKEQFSFDAQAETLVNFVQEVTARR